MTKEAQFKLIYKNSKDKVYRLCLGFMGNKASADDLFQEVLLKIWQHLDNFRQESTMATWVYRITVNTALYTLNQEKKRQQHKDDFKFILKETTTQEITDGKQQQVKKLYQTIATLKEIDRILIGLLLEGCSYAEIATITELSISNVGVRINRIKKILNKKLN